jgi:hypothetical protein
MEARPRTNGADDAGADAALLARALPGRPVRVQWMREEEHSWEPFGPAMVTRARAALDGGRISSWEFDVWSNTHSTRPGKAGELGPASLLAKPFPPSAPRPIPQPEGGGDRNAIPLYTIPHAKVTHRFIPEMPLRARRYAHWRYMNVFDRVSWTSWRPRRSRRWSSACVIRIPAADVGAPRRSALVDARALARAAAGFRRFYKNLAAYCVPWRWK